MEGGVKVRVNVCICVSVCVIVQGSCKTDLVTGTVTFTVNGLPD